MLISASLDYPEELVGSKKQLAPMTGSESYGSAENVVDFLVARVDIVEVMPQQNSASAQQCPEALKVV